MLNIFKNKSAAVSLPKAKAVHGIEVKKVPIGKYIETLREMEELFPKILAELFGENATFSEIIATLTTLSSDALFKLLSRLLVIMPEHVIKILADILDTAPDTMMGLTPNEAWDVGHEYWEMNDMTDFFGRVSGLIRAKLPTLINGFSTGLPLPKVSGSVKKPS